MGKCGFINSVDVFYPICSINSQQQPFLLVRQYQKGITKELFQQGLV